MSQPQFRIFPLKFVPITGPCLQKEKIICINTSFRSISSIQSLSHVWLYATSWTAARQAPLSITNSQSLPKFTSIKSVMPSSYLILCRPLLLLPPISPSTRVFFNSSHEVAKVLSFSFSIIPSKGHPGQISFRIDWVDLLAVQGTLKSLLQHHSSKEKKRKSKKKASMFSSNF